MFKRIEFTLNLEDPDEAALYHALRLSLRGRPAGAVIRQALKLHYARRLATNDAIVNQPHVAWRGEDDEA